MSSIKSSAATGQTVFWGVWVLSACLVAFGPLHFVLDRGDEHSESAFGWVVLGTYTVAYILSKVARMIHAGSEAENS